jgi:hydrogenase-1 operon protein HyaF
MTADRDFFRPNPFKWENEPEAQGVFTSRPDDAPHLLGVDSLAPMRRAPSLSRLETEAALGPVRDMLGEVLETLKFIKSGDVPRQWSLDGLSADSRAVVSDALGSGEVSVLIGGDAALNIPTLQIEETVLTGVWMGRAVDANEQVVMQWLEVADVPAAVESATRRMCLDTLEVPARAPVGAMNVLPVLAEIKHRASLWRPGQPNHVINFTLLPMTPEDMDVLTIVLGRMPVTLYSGGYGACQVLSTGIRNVWAVQFLNSMGTVILDTLEIGETPAAARAGDADFEDSAERLAEILEAYAS